MAISAGFGLEDPRRELASKRRSLWSRLAYATRYGGISLGEAAALDHEDLGDYLEQIAKIVGEENKAGGPRG